MSAVTSLPTRAHAAHPAAPITTLVGVELRKMVDTRAGRWLLSGVAAATVIALGVVIATGDAGDRSFSSLFSYAQLPFSILLPVLGVLAATSEWGQRTVLTTFALVPSRSRVLGTKLAAVSVLSLVAVAFALVAAAAGALVAPLAGATGSDWSLGVSDFGEALVYQQLCMLLGFALGTLVLNSALAIVLYFVLPIVWNALSGSISGLADAQLWLDSGMSWTRLIEPGAVVTATNWAQAGTTAAVWIVLPLAIGTARILRREVD